MSARVPCHVCGDPVAVRTDGCFRQHSRYPAVSRFATFCEGTNQRADDARLAARGKVYIAADDARRARAQAASDIDHARAKIERLESQLPTLESRAVDTAQALAAFDREHPASDVRRVPVDGGGR